ncbi:MAG: hypothetical protein WC747_00720 [Candidatus Babeliales bacterium]|jgi:hypothetical protein
MKKSIKRTKKSVASKKTVTRRKTAAPRKKSAASKKSGSFMSGLKKMFFPTLLAMISVSSMNADCGGCKAKPINKPVRVEKVRSNCGGCSARPVKIKAKCGRVGCTAKPVHVNQQVQTKKEMKQDLHEMKKAKVEHTNKLATLKKQGKVNSPEAANHRSIIQTLELDISDLKDKIESLA